MKAQKKEKIANREVIYGAHAIIEMLKAKRRKLVALYTRKPLPQSWMRIKPYLPANLPPIHHVDKNVLDGIAQSPEHMGVVAVVSPFPFTNTMFDPQKAPFILLLDGVQDVGNLGNILRSAYCSGVSGVVLCKKMGAPLSPAAIKSSAGLAEHLSIYQAPSIAHAVQEIKKVGYTLYMAVIDGQPALTVDYQTPLCLVIGNEATGITKEMRKQGIPITIPQRTQDISYNASVAAGILLVTIGWKSKILK